MQLPKGTYQRTNLQFLTGCILDEDQQGYYDESTYEERLSKDKEALMEKLSSVLLKREEFLDIESLLNATLSTFEDVFFEIGLKAGAKLQRELLSGY